MKVRATRLGVLMVGVAGLATSLTMLARALYLAVVGGNCGAGAGGRSSCSISGRAIGTLPISITGIVIFVIVIVLSSWIVPRITMDPVATWTDDAGGVDASGDEGDSLPGIPAGSTAIDAGRPVADGGGTSDPVSG